VPHDQTPTGACDERLAAIGRLLRRGLERADPEARRRGIAELWAPDGAHYVKSRECRGYRQLEARVAGSHEKNVTIGKNRFRARPNVQLLQDAVTFNWEMLPQGSDEVLAVGLEFLMLGEDRRIVADYQFIVA
jgi:hypothetical protein